MKLKLWISWGVWAAAALMLATADKVILAQICAFISTGFGFAAFLFGDKL